MTSQGDGEDKGEHVVLVVDCSMRSWTAGGDLSEAEVPPNRRCDVFLAFESVYLLESAIKLFHADNTTCVIAAGASPVRVASTAELASHATNEPVSIVKALTMTLCIINRDLKDRSSSTTATRIVLVTATPIPAYDFVTCMNCAFAAQKFDIVIDVLDYSQSSTPELLQLVHHTNGWFVNLSPKDGQQGSLAHALLYYFVAPSSSRTSLNAPSCPATDMRTICFCHQKLISIGYVCSVCLYVFCEKKNECSACRSRVPIVLKRRTA